MDLNSDLRGFRRVSGFRLSALRALRGGGVLPILMMGAALAANSILPPAAAAAEGAAPGSAAGDLATDVSLLRAINGLNLSTGQLRGIIQYLSQLQDAQARYQQKEAAANARVQPQLRRVRAALVAGHMPGADDQEAVSGALEPLKAEAGKLVQARRTAVENILKELTSEQMTKLRLQLGLKANGGENVAPRQLPQFFGVPGAAPAGPLILRWGPEAGEAAPQAITITPPGADAGNGVVIEALPAAPVLGLNPAAAAPEPAPEAGTEPEIAPAAGAAGGADVPLPTATPAPATALPAPTPASTLTRPPAPIAPDGAQANSPTPADPATAGSLAKLQGEVDQLQRQVGQLERRNVLTPAQIQDLTRAAFAATAARAQEQMARMNVATARAQDLIKMQGMGAIGNVQLQEGNGGAVRILNGRIVDFNAAPPDGVTDEEIISRFFLAPDVIRMLRAKAAGQ